MLLMIITSLTILPWDPAAQCLPLTTRAVRWNPPPPGRVWGGSVLLWPLLRAPPIFPLLAPACRVRQQPCSGVSSIPSVRSPGTEPKSCLFPSLPVSSPGEQLENDSRVA